MNRKVKLLMISGIMASVLAAAVLLLLRPGGPAKNPPDLVPLAPDQDVLVTTSITSPIYIGEPFEYKIRVSYRPEMVKPDFRRLLRDVSFIPFEQLHRSRTHITENTGHNEQYEYELGYSLVAINVIPGTVYELEPVTVYYPDQVTGEINEIKTEARTVSVAMYYDMPAMDIPLQPLKGRAEDTTGIKRLMIIVGGVLFTALGMGCIWAAVRRRHRHGQSIADRLRYRYEALQTGSADTRQKLLGYEKIVLSLLKHYGNRSARTFWTQKEATESSAWQRHAGLVKSPLQSAYASPLPGDGEILLVEEVVENIYAQVGPGLAEERLTALERLEGSARDRIAQHRLLFAGGIAGLFFAMMFLYLLVNPQIWADRNAQVFNTWMDSLPARLLDENKLHELGMLDVEMLGHISDQQRVLANLELDALRSAYLYNYGTLVASIYKVILTMPPREEEEEAPEPPSFDYPLQLLANSARFYPYDEDTRRNLEIVIKLKQSQQKKDSQDVQGELGPPTPGFSRDMNPLLF